MNGLLELRVDDLSIDRANPRRNPRPSDDLVASIATSGIIEPLIVRRYDGSYHVVCGSRRLAAARAAGLEVVPCLARDDLDDAAALALGLQENTHRADMDPIEQGYAYEELIETHGWTVEQAAEAVGVSAATVRGRLQMLTLPDEVQQRVADGELTIKGALKFATRIGRRRERTAPQRVVDLDAVDDVDPDQVDTVGEIGGCVEVAVPAAVWRAVTTAAAMAGATPGAWLVGAIRDRVIKEHAHRSRPGDGRAGAARRSGNLAQVHVRSAPVVERIERRGGIGVVTGHLNGKERESWRQSYHRAKTSGQMTVSMADRFCLLLLEETPAMVYGPEWHDAA